MSRKIPHALFVLVIGLVVTASASATTYYVAANGNDSNSGTSKSTPWLHAPGMPSCSATCAATTPQAGDSIILRGGDTWHFHSGTPATGGTWTISWSGTSTNCQLDRSAGAVVKASCIYIGTDHTWYSGGSYARPILNQDNAVNNSRPSSCTYDSTSLNAINAGSHNYLIIDDFELLGACLNGSSNAGWVNVSGTQVEVSNLYEHGFELSTQSGVDDTYATINGGMSKGNYILCDHNVFDNSDGSLGNTGGTGFSIRNTCKEISYNYFKRHSNGCICNPSSVHDNTFDHMYEPVTTQHGNLVETNGGVSITGALYWYNNLAHDITTVGFWPEPVQANLYFFNNVLWNINDADNCFLVDGQGKTGVPVSVYVHNITSDSSCKFRLYGQHSGQEFNGTGNFSNGHYIGYQSSTCTGSCATPLQLTYSIESGATATIVNNGGHVFQSVATANGDGYAQGSNYAPTAAGSATVGAGTNESTFCSGITDSQASTACQNGTSAGVREVVGEGGMTVSSPGTTVNPRSGAWDAGAYQLSTSGINPPAPPSGLAAIVQ